MLGVVLSEWLEVGRPVTVLTAEALATDVALAADVVRVLAAVVGRDGVAAQPVSTTAASSATKPAPDRVRTMSDRISESPLW
ncbi:MAG: hypothetical protein DLM57_03130 [Pseudonocardiales bacterium]|nr:MAG: hypothetical protein DLM57_03130 [Pseudonocardiales bacterium]